MNNRSIGLARVVRAWLNGSSPLLVQACSAMLRIRVTRNSADIIFIFCLTDSVSEPDGLLRLCSLLFGARQMRFNWERQHVSGNIRRQRVTHFPDKRLASFIWDFGHVA
jgi:hypothetical protein